MDRSQSTSAHPDGGGPHRRGNRERQRLRRRSLGECRRAHRLDQGGAGQPGLRSREPHPSCRRELRDIPVGQSHEGAGSFQPAGRRRDLAAGGRLAAARRRRVRRQGPPTRPARRGPGHRRLDDPARGRTQPPAPDLSRRATGRCVDRGGGGRVRHARRVHPHGPTGRTRGRSRRGRGGLVHGAHRRGSRSPPRCRSWHCHASERTRPGGTAHRRVRRGAREVPQPDPGRRHRTRRLDLSAPRPPDRGIRHHRRDRHGRDPRPGRDPRRAVSGPGRGTGGRGDDGAGRGTAEGADRGSGVQGAGREASGPESVLSDEPSGCPRRVTTARDAGRP